MYQPVKEVFSLFCTKKKDWKTEEMPDETSSFELNKSISKNEYASLLLGHEPKEMEDKWFAYVESNVLFIHRGWTGFCIFMTEIEKTKDGYLLSKTIVNRNAHQYTNEDLDDDIDLLRLLIDLTLLKKPVSLTSYKPIPPPIKKQQKRQSRWGKLLRKLKK